MPRKTKQLSISSNELDEAIAEELQAREYGELRNDDWTVQRLMEQGLAETSARRILYGMVEKGLAEVVRVRHPHNRSIMKAYRKREKMEG